MFAKTIIHTQDQQPKQFQSVQGGLNRHPQQDGYCVEKKQTNREYPRSLSPYNMYLLQQTVGNSRIVQLVNQINNVQNLRTGNRSSLVQRAKQPYIVTNPKTHLYTEPPELKSINTRVPQYKVVEIVDSTIKPSGKKSKEYVLVQASQSDNISTVSVPYGWILKSTLVALDIPINYKLSSSDKVKGKNLSTKQFAESVIKRAYKANEKNADKKGEAVETNKKEADKDAAEWFNNFVYTTFLGRVTASPIHKILADHLKKVEAKFVASFGGPLKSPSVAGNALGLSANLEPIKGSRESATSSEISMHFFGLAIDLDYTNNPFITEEKVDKEATNKVLPRAGLLVEGSQVRFSNKMSAEDVLKLDEVLEKYFSYLDNDNLLSERLKHATANNVSGWKNMPLAKAKQKIKSDLLSVATVWGRAKDIIKKGGFTDFRRELIEGIGLHWGGSDYGDMMHFDMRNIGIGNIIDRERRK